MKKFLTLAFACLAAGAFAQNFTAKNSLAVSAGPNWFQQFSGGIADDSEYAARIGFATRLEYARTIAPRWQVTLGAAYHVLNFSVVQDGLQWPSEWQNGQYVYDPSLPHSISYDYADHAWQLLGGLRWLGKPQVLRPYALVETGLTGYIRDDGSRDDAPLRLTVGAGFGLEWQPGRFGLFLQPTAHYVFQNFSKNSFQGYRFLIPAIQAGGRLHF